MAFSPAALRTSGAAALVALALTLTGCAGGQSAAQACEILEQDVEQINTELSTAFGSLADPEGIDEAAALLQKLESTLKESAEKVTNEEVAPVVNELVSSLGGINASMEEYAPLLSGMADLDYSDTAAMEEFQGQMETLGTDLEGNATKMQEAGNDMQALCS